MFDALGLTFLAALVAMLPIWLLSIRLRDVSIVDIWWGPGFAMIAVIAWALAGAGTERALALLACTAAWGLRLGIHLLVRRLGHSGEDPRYGRMRARSGSAFWWRSLFTVFVLQAVVMWIVSLPIQLGIYASYPSVWTWLDSVGLALFVLGFAMEIVADAQLAAFKRDPGNKGRVMDRGLWAWSRHPNYFGEALLHWGLFVLAMSAPLAWPAIIAPIIMTVLLRAVSGVPMLEYGMKQTRPGYGAYAARTSPFILWPPKRA